MAEVYDDVRGYLAPVTRENVNNWIDPELNLMVGYDEESDSYALVTVDSTVEEGYIDHGFRIKIEKYGALNSAPAKNSKRVARVTLAFGETWRGVLTGIYVNQGKEGQAFLHWPNDQRGHVNLMEFIYNGKGVSMAPYILMAYFTWMDENEASNEVRAYMDQFFGGNDASTTQG